VIRLILVPFVMAIASVLNVPIHDGRQDTLEDDVKAVFLYNFTKFVDWPTFAFRTDDEAFRVCALAEAAFVKTLRGVLEGETARGRPLQLVVPEANQIPQCHILFIGRSESTSVSKILPLTTGRPVLTVGEISKFLEQGGVVNFVVENDRVRFDVDLASAQRAGLGISSKLLRVARHVREPLR
jgi:uncharacterized protein DUF4154